MKNWLTQIAVASFAVAALASCKKDEEQATIAPSATSTLSASSSTVVLMQANSAQTALTFNWTPVQFAVGNTEYTKAPTVSYQLQVAKSATSFGYPAIIDAGTGTMKAISVGDLNSSLTTLGLTSGVATPLYARLATVVGTDNHTFVSNVIPLTATTYTVCLPPAGSDSWSIIGPAGVDWNTDVPLTYNCTTNTFDITRVLNAGEFKFRANSAWTLNYGSSSNAGGPVVANGSNIVVTTAGAHTVKLNLNTMTYSIN